MANVHLVSIRFSTPRLFEHEYKPANASSKSKQAYSRGDGQAAHQLSEEGKRHGQMMEQYNKQASDYIFRENNAVGRVDGDTIDLHGQFVEEAEEILEARIRYALQTGQTHLHVYVRLDSPALIAAFVTPVMLRRLFTSACEMLTGSFN